MQACKTIMSVVAFFALFQCSGQMLEGTLAKVEDLSSRWIKTLQHKANRIETSMDDDLNKWLRKLEKEECKLKRKLMRRDSVVAQQIFGNVEEQYKLLRSDLQQPIVLESKKGEYLPHVDSLKAALGFLTTGNLLFADNAIAAGKVKVALKSVTGVEGKLYQAKEVQRLVEARRKLLKDQLGRLGLLKELKRFNQQAFYYGQQINVFKSLLEDPSPVEQKAMKLLMQIPACQEFFKNTSMLGSLFRLPDDYGSMASLGGLQTRNSVQQVIQDRIAAAGPNATSMLQQNVQAARDQLGKLKDKLNELGGVSHGETELPDFKSNNQKTKTFLQRLEYGTNLQSERSSGYFPVTTDLGLSVGYKLNDRSIIGIGASYKVGWGRDIRNIVITNEGIGLRSFADVKLKGSFFASGGFEYNYQQPFGSFNIVQQLDAWHQSGLVGVSKVVSINSKVFKKTHLQLFWDFLSYQQMPKTQPLKFRVGYRF